jgi:hypothetical protein
MLGQFEGECGYKIWAVDDVVYGPVDMPTLVDWIKDERVLGETWIFDLQKDEWSKAGEMAELRAIFGRLAAAGGGPREHTPLVAGIKPGMLRRVKILGEMSDQAIGRFAQFMEVQNASQFHTVVKQGERGDAMFCLLDGEVRVRQMIGGKETVLATLLKISTDNFQRLTKEAPELATPFLSAICKTLVARIRADNKRLKDSINFARASR